MFPEKLIATDFCLFYKEKWRRFWLESLRPAGYFPSLPVSMHDNIQDRNTFALTEGPARKPTS